MCGIVGRVSVDRAKVTKENVRNTLGHRGPDGVDVIHENILGKFLFFGHSRLSILDISVAGSQPMESKNGRYIIVYNGEIYNHLELRKDLEGPFASDCDTETLIEAIARWGVKQTLSLINGIFSFAVLDRQEGVVYLARDPCGVKPLYFSHSDKKLTFASELRALGLVSDKSKTIDKEGLDLFLTYRFTPSPTTIWEGVFRLRPGHLATYNISSEILQISCELPRSKPPFKGSFKKAVERYDTLLSSAIRRQLRSDVPVGVLLSGGIDSAVVAALAIRAGARDKLTAFTVGFGGEHAECEIGYAKKTAEILNIPHRVISIDEDSAWRSLEPALQHVEEPLATTSLIPMWSLCALAKSEVKVVLTGQGSDELWGGYQRYQAALLGQIIPRGRVWQKLANLGFCTGRYSDELEKLFRSFGQRREKLFLKEIYSLFSRDQLKALGFEPSILRQLKPLEYWFEVADSGRKIGLAERMMSIDLRMNLADDLLLYGDRVSMAHSLEARVPMLDNDIVLFAESLPRHMRLGFLKPKKLHRKLAKKILPKEIINRPKLGFHVPFGTWIRGPWRNRVGNQLFSNVSLGKVIDIRGVEQIWNAHQNMERDSAKQIFALLALSYSIDRMNLGEGS